MRATSVRPRARDYWSVFGYPNAHEDDVRRAVQAGVEITRDVARLSEQAKRRFEIQIDMRVGVHRGLVYLDTTQDDVYGLAANLAARVSALAPPGAVVVSDSVEPLIRHAFERGVVDAARLCKRCDGSDPPLPGVGRARRDLARVATVHWSAAIVNGAAAQEVGCGHRLAR